MIKHKKTLVVAGCLTFVILAICVFLSPPVSTAFYEWLYDRWFVQATQEVDTALASYNGAYQFTGNTSCTHELIAYSPVPSSLDQQVTNKNSWPLLHANCMTRAQEGTLTMNIHDTYSLPTTIDTLQKQGWEPNTEALNYGLIYNPNGDGSDEFLGASRKEIPGGMCWFTVTRFFDMNSTQQYQAGKTTLSTKVWCDKGRPTFRQ